MNNNGFTLIELLVTITILGLIVGIAIPSYNGISSAIRNNQRNNIIEKIEIAASKYAFDTGETIIFVEKLITEGYYDGDTEEGIIKDPLGNGNLNCYIVEMEKVSNYYNATFKDDKNYENNGTCDLSKLNENSEKLSILVNGNEYINDEWLKGNVSLKAYSKNTLVIDCANNRCVWTSSSGAEIRDTDIIELNNVNGILDTKYTFQYTIFDDDSSSIERYTTSISLKVDNSAPVIYVDEIIVSNRFIYTKTKDIKISASDGKGSGINGYFIGKDITNCNSTSIINSYQSSNSFSINENGKYLICVKDNVGNITTSSININYIS